jgi:hypothetical protein
MPSISLPVSSFTLPMAGRIITKRRTLAGFTDPNSHQWYMKGGIRRQWIGLGHTILYAEYGRYIDQLSPAALAAGATGSELDRFDLGVVQEIDTASMSVLIKYRQQAADVSGVALDLDEFRCVSTGALINF